MISNLNFDFENSINAALAIDAEGLCYEASTIMILMVMNNDACMSNAVSVADVDLVLRKIIL